MRAAQGRYGIALVAILSVAACSGNKTTPHLMQLRVSGTSPDEFAILPSKPLQMPKDPKSLPEPTPGGSNLADPTPVADAVRALGGKPGAASGIPAADQALVAYAERGGVAPGIRQELDAQDLRFRQNHNGRVLDRLFGNSVYNRAYRAMELDQYAALAFWRSRGIATPSAPPQGVSLPAAPSLPPPQQ